MQHTQGPWYADPTAQYEHMADCLLENQTWIAVEADDGHVAYCHPDNADLIAAAPELLASLQEVMPFAAMRLGGTTDGEPLLEKARAAIAKATAGLSREEATPLAFSLAASTVPGARLLKRRHWSIH